MFSTILKRTTFLIIVLITISCQKNVVDPEKELRATLAGTNGIEWQLSNWFQNGEKQSMTNAQRSFRMKLLPDLTYEDTDGHVGNWRSHKSTPADSLLIVFQNPMQGFIVTDYSIKSINSNTLELNYLYNNQKITLCYKK